MKLDIQKDPSQKANQIVEKVLDLTTEDGGIPPARATLRKLVHYYKAKHRKAARYILSLCFRRRWYS